MIGAFDHEHAMRETGRCAVGYTPDRTCLEIWNGATYVNAELVADEHEPGRASGSESGKRDHDATQI